MNQITPGGEIRETGLSDALSERYLAYALSTIVSRSLPDVRDGLKPVHRRILYAMRQLKLDPETGFKKCARVVGDVIGKYHPHGDAAVYEAMVRLAQDFAVRYPLVEGQGNFGNIDGDNAAAMRYTESKLTQVASAIMDGLDEDAVDFRPTYDGSESEPVVMPSAFPNLLANGSSGIAVGMATNIPPHNVAELCDALGHIIKKPSCPVDELVGFVRGPDFPTGGILAEPGENILEAYRTGRGGFRLRARWEVEKLKQGLWQVVVTEIPYQVQKAKLIERIAGLLSEKKLPLLADVRDESTDVVRVVFEPKNRTVQPEVLMEQLFRQTDLETRISLNMNVLDADGVPRVMNLKEVLRAFLDHRMVVLERRAKHRLGRIEHRLEVLGGYLVAYLNLDAVIKIIRNEDEPKPALMKKFKLSDVQAEAILNMRLRALRKLEEIEIKREHDRLSAEKAELESLLGDEGKRWRAIGAEIKDIRKKFGPETALGKRRSDISGPPPVIDVPMEAMVEHEDLTVVLSEKGWVRAMKGHLEDNAELKYKEGDGPAFILPAATTSKILVFASNGRFYTLSGDKLPKGRGHGEPIRLMIDLPNDAEIVSLVVHKPGDRLLLASAMGRGFVVEETEVLASTRSGKQVMNLDDGDKAMFAVPVDGDHVAIIGENRKMLIFPLDQVPEMGKGRGVILQRYKDAHLSDLKVFVKKEGLTWLTGGRTRTESDLKPWIGERAQAGRLPPNGFPRSNRFDG
ncbi:MAG: DNA topoisomerase IV subunit A [Rhodospirillales bacterium]|jgi:topoisomerase-4 subunit A|nr:DNA topoisomerase IV subunit A [Rhodospirillales bacterium]